MDRHKVPSRAVDEKHAAGLDSGGYRGSVCPRGGEASLGAHPFSAFRGRWTAFGMTEGRGLFPLAFLSRPPGLAGVGVLTTDLL